MLISVDASEPLASNESQTRPASDEPGLGAGGGRVVDIDGYGFGEEVDGLGALLSDSYSRLLHAAEGQVYLASQRRGVDVDDPGLHGVDVPERLGDVEDSPNLTLLDMLTASSRSAALNTVSTGPNISSWAMRMLVSTSVKMVGST